MDLLKPDQLATELQISRRQLDRLIADGLPYILVGRAAKRFDPQTVKTWLTRNQKCRRAETQKVTGMSIYGSRVESFIDVCARVKADAKQKRLKQSLGSNLQVVK